MFFLHASTRTRAGRVGLFAVADFDAASAAALLPLFLPLGLQAARPSLKRVARPNISRPLS